MRKLLEDFVLPAARELPHDMLNQNFEWRDARLYTEAVDLKLKAKEPLLRASFESARAPRAREIDFPRWEMFVDETCRNWTKDAGASARRRASTTEIPRASVLARSFGDAEDLKDAATPGAAAGYFRGVTNLESRLAFSWCQLTVFDRLQRKDYKALSYLEFLEALCRCADFMDPTPDVTLDLKLDAVFEVLERRAERAAAKSGRRAAYVATPPATPKAPKAAPASPRALFKGPDVHRREPEPAEAAAGEAASRVAREKETSDAGARLVRLHEQLLDGDVRVALEDLGGDALQGLLGEVRAVVPRGPVSVEDHEPVRPRGLLDAEGVLAGLRGGFGVDGGTGGRGGAPCRGRWGRGPACTRRRSRRCGRRRWTRASCAAPRGAPARRRR